MNKQTEERLLKLANIVVEAILEENEDARHWAMATAKAACLDYHEFSFLKHKTYEYLEYHENKGQVQ